MARPCDFGHCDISRCTDKDCASLNEDVGNGAASVECSKTLPQHPVVAEKEIIASAKGLPCGAKTKSLYACGKLSGNKLLWMKGGIKKVF